ncbi:hypothetical protein ACFOTA_06805 [Chitinophaga sp. GCM10012297]|nr:hypothetical protein [Chitinophaga chungangae]
MAKVEFRCTDTLKSKIQKAAKKEKKSVAEYLRELVVAAQKKK